MTRPTRNIWERPKPNYLTPPAGRYVNPNSEVGEHVRPRRDWSRRAAGILRVKLKRTLETYWCARVFSEGAENCARGGRAPIACLTLADEEGGKG